MTIATLDAAKTLGNLSGWSMTNLEMQKMLYFAHMFFLGRTGQPLVPDNFEAWDRGPVIPALYHKVKFFGSDPIWDIFSGSKVIRSGLEFEILRDIYANLSKHNAGQLVALAHREGGAWANHYVPNRKGIKIPNADIITEYQTLYA